MSAEHRSLSRLPLNIFKDLCLRSANGDGGSPEALRREICSKLAKFSCRSCTNGDVIHDSVATVGQLFGRLSKLTLMRVLDPLLTYDECDLLYRRVGLACAPEPRSAFALLEKAGDMANLSVTTFGPPVIARPRHSALTDEYPWCRIRSIPTGVASLDDCLRGGFRIGAITEIVGHAGAGKTQLAMQLCVMAACNGQGCIYVDTDKKLNLLRMHKIAEQRFANSLRTGSPHHEVRGLVTNQHVSCNLSSSSSFATRTDEPRQDAALNITQTAAASYRDPTHVLDNVIVFSPTTTPELLSTLVEVEKLILVRNQDAAEALADDGPSTGNASDQQFSQRLGPFPIRLLVVDSIAAASKRGTCFQSPPERASAVFKVAQRLKRLAHQLHLAVLVTNQVSLERKGDLVTRNRTEQPMDEAVTKAALGNSWYHCVSTRIELKPILLNGPLCLHRQGLEAHDPCRKVRTASVAKSNLVGLRSIEYEVVTAGIVEAKTHSTTGASSGLHG